MTKASLGTSSELINLIRKLRWVNEEAERSKFKLDVRGAFLRRTDLSFASLRGADLAGADFTNAILRGADLADARLDGTILKGADLTEARNLTLSQLKKAILDERTKLPEGFTLDRIVTSG